MAKNKTTAAERAAAKAEAEEGQGAFNFDLAAIEAEAAEAAKAVREKHLAPARKRLDALTAQRAEIDAEIEKLDRMLNPNHSPKRSGGSISSGKRTRMSAADIERLSADAIAFVGRHAKEGVSRSQVAEALGIESAKAAGILGKLKGTKIESKGKRKNARWFPK